MADSTTDSARPTLLDRLLRPFGRVKRGEGLQALLLLLCIFLILTSYYLMKVAREGLVLSGGTFGLRAAEVKSYAGGAMALMLFAISPAYSALAGRVKRIRLINTLYLGVIACLFIFAVLARLNAPIGLAFFVWIGIVNLFQVALFWSYANDLYSDEQGKRLFPIIAIGGSIGGVLGPKLADHASTYSLLIFAAVLLIACVILFNLIEHGHMRRSDKNDVAHEPIDGGGRGGFSLILRDRYLLLIAALVLVSELVKTNGEFVLSSVATEHAAALIPSSAHADLIGAAHTAAISADRRDAIQAFYGQFFFWVNLASLLLQAFAVSRLIAKLGVRRTLFIMPIIALGAYGAIGFIGGIMLVRVAKTSENSTEYSIENTVRQTLFLPTDRPTKYKAKAAIDTFVVRSADAISALMVWFGIHALGTNGRGLALMNVGLVVIWLAIAVGLARRHKQLSPDQPKASAT